MIEMLGIWKNARDSEYIHNDEDINDEINQEFDIIFIAKVKLTKWIITDVFSTKHWLEFLIGGAGPKYTNFHPEM